MVVGQAAHRLVESDDQRSLVVDLRHDLVQQVVVGFDQQVVAAGVADLHADGARDADGVELADGLRAGDDFAAALGGAAFGEEFGQIRSLYTDDGAYDGGEQGET